jgi:phage replication O-like protein O
MNRPNYTQIPNVILDDMGQFSQAGFKVLCAICRKTIGWHKDTDRISMSQLVKMTGMSVNTIKDAIKELDGKWINQHDLGEGRGYSYDLAISEVDTEPCQELTPPPSEVDTVPCQNLTPQKKLVKDTSQNIIKYSRFAPPTIQEVSDYMSTLQNYEVGDDMAMHDYYTANGWKVGRAVMKDWQATCRTWLRNKAKWGRGVKKPQQVDATDAGKFSHLVQGAGK